MPNPRKASKVTTEGLDQPMPHIPVAETVSAPAPGIPNRPGSTQATGDITKMDIRADFDTPIGTSRRTMGGGNATPKVFPSMDLSMKKTKFDGGYHKLPIPFHFAWKPNRKQRDLPQLPKTDDKHYAEDMIYFGESEDVPASVSTVEDMMMLCTSIPPPHNLFESERYFIFPVGSTITWEDPTFVDCGAAKVEISAHKLFEEPSVAMELWLTIVALATGGSLSGLSPTFDIRGLRITRKKSIVIEFWIGRKNTEATNDGESQGRSLDVIGESNLQLFCDAIHKSLSENVPSANFDRISIQKFS